MATRTISAVDETTEAQYSALEKEAQALYHTVDTTGLVRISRQPTRTLIVLDFDGSNSPFVPHADDAQLYRGLRERIIGLKARGYTLAFSSGRGLYDLISATGIPHVENYAGSHGNQVLIRKTHFHDHMPEERDIALQAAYSSIIGRIIPSLTFQPDVEIKPGNAVLHWRAYTEFHKWQGEELAAFERALYDAHINPAVEAYNASVQDPTLRVKVANHGRNADFSAANARTKGDALIDFFKELKAVDGRQFRNIITINDSGTDGDMILKADQLKGEYGVFPLAVTVQQESTPEWMRTRPPYDVFLPFCTSTDPDMKFGGVPLVPFVYDTLLGR